MNSIVRISPRLLPSVDVSGAAVSVSPARGRDHYGKPEWRWYVDLPDGREFEGAELFGWGDAGEMLESLLAFLSACGEGVAYSRRTGRESENSGLFPPELADWCDSVSDELGMAQSELEAENESRRGR